jgi:hypothetical protein
MSMKCLRCGYCCTYYCVMIVDDPKKGINDKDNFIFQKGDTKCKHLVGDKIGEYSCAIHNEDWYSETPCFAFDQIGKDKANCRMGEHILSIHKGKKIEEIKNIKKHLT